MESIPDAIKAEIFQKYLEGYSTTKISKLYNVSVGSVSSITREESNKDNDYFQIREITKIFKKNNLNISDVISGIRLYNKIKKVGLDITFFENFIDSTNTESFRLKKDHSKFLEDIKKIVQFEELYRIKIEKIPGYMINTIKQLKNLKEENKKIIEKTTGLYLQYNIEKSEIEEYVEEKPLFLQYKRDKDRYPKYPEWIVNDTLFEEASRKIGTKIDPQTLYNKLKWIYLLPHKHRTIIKK
ncbi:MAG TPA: hypothetical protein VFP49_05640 [Nitrososphaeraceae archaeon]|nr:hypothetical protein [Nitrososphaeraceae archaeon]